MEDHQEILIPGLPNEIGRECLIRIPYKQFSTVVAVSNRWRQEINSKEFHQRRRNRGFKQNLIVLIQADPVKVEDSSELTTVQKIPITRLSLYEPETNQWEKLPPIPGYSVDGGLPMFCQCAGVGRSLVVIGGWDTRRTWKVSNSVYVFDLVTATWRRGADMPGVKRSFFGCASDSDRRVLVAGGHDENKNALRSALAYDVVEDEWVPLPDLAKERDECKGLFHGGKFHVIGGYESERQGKFDKTSEAFDVANWRWGPIEEDKLRAATCPRTCVFDHDGVLHKCGPACMERFEGSTWKQLTDLPLDVRSGAYVLSWQDKMLVIGSDLQGGPHSCYVLEFGEGEKCAWRKVETSQEFTGYVQSGCNLDILSYYKFSS